MIILKKNKSENLALSLQPGKENFLKILKGSKLL